MSKIELTDHQLTETILALHERERLTMHQMTLRKNDKFKDGLVTQLEEVQGALKAVCSAASEKVRIFPQIIETPADDIQRTYSQHPMYEQWKNVCPQCSSQFTRHHSGSAEDKVVLECECGQRFTLKEAFMKQYEIQDTVRRA